MDVGYTFGSPHGQRASIYLPPPLEPPIELTATMPDGSTVTFVRVSDRELDCGSTLDVPGKCTSEACHRLQLGVCQCGRHRSVFDPPTDPRPSIGLRRLTPPAPVRSSHDSSKTNNEGA